MRECDAPLPDEMLLDYWAGDSAPDATEAVEAHLFECGDCAARLTRLASMGAGVAALVRQGRVSGIISRALLNRMQRDGVNLRLYALSPGETVPCAVFPGDDLVVASLRADFSNVHAVTLSVIGPEEWPVSEVGEVPVAPSESEVLWAVAGAVVRQMPSMRLRLTLSSADADGAVLGEYVLEHSAAEPASR
jgi:anti-sigma factor RsiW